MTIVDGNVAANRPRIRPLDAFGSARSVRGSSVNFGGHAPLQGFDAIVTAFDPGRNREVLLGAFTEITLNVQAIPEVYLAVGSKMPIYLDSEINLQLSMERGLLDALVFQETFGVKTLRPENRYIRQPRLRITFGVDPVDWFALDDPARTFGGAVKERTPSMRVVLDMVKVTHFGLMARAGKSVIATRWDCLPESIEVTGLSYNNIPGGASLFKPDGDPVSDLSTKTFFYEGFSDMAVLNPQNILPARDQPWPGLPGASDLLGTAVGLIDGARRLGDIFSEVGAIPNANVGDLAGSFDRHFPGVLPSWLGGAG